MSLAVAGSFTTSQPWLTILTGLTPAAVRVASASTHGIGCATAVSWLLMWTSSDAPGKVFTGCLLSATPTLPGEDEQHEWFVHSRRIALCRKRLAELEARYAWYYPKISQQWYDQLDVNPPVWFYKMSALTCLICLLDQICQLGIAGPGTIITLISCLRLLAIMLLALTALPL
eukprot:gene8294-7620_t